MEENGLNREKDRLNVLLTNHELMMPGGCITLLYSMAQEYLRLGHRVTLYSPRWGEGGVPEYFEASGVTITKVKPLNLFDIVVCNHRDCLPIVEDMVHSFKIWHFDGKMRERIPEDDFDVYIVVSEESRDYLKEKFDIDSLIVRNAINCTRFDIHKPIRKRLSRVLFLSNHGEVAPIVKEATKQVGLAFTWIGRDSWVFDVERYINDADLVVTIGRGVYESMACGRNVIVFDYLGAEGILTPDKYFEIRQKNCSGRYHQMDWGVAELVNEFKKYNPGWGYTFRKYALEHHNIQKLVAAHIGLYELHHRERYSKALRERGLEERSLRL